MINIKEIKARLDAAGYEVTEDGQVWSLDSNWRGYGKRLLAQHPNSHGYPRVRMLLDGKRKSVLVHKLVAEVFLGPKPEGKTQVCHKDDNKNHNHVSNLYYGTAKDNALDRTLNGKSYSGAHNGNYKTHCLRGHDLEIYGRQRKTGGRACKECQRIRQRGVR